MVEVLNCGIGSLIQRLEGKRIFCFGSGKQAEFFFEKYSGMGIEDKVGGFVDNDTAKDGTKKIINGIEILIISYLNFVKIHDENDVVLITSRYWKEILKQMDEDIRLDGMICYIDLLLDNTYETDQFEVGKYTDKPIIPRVIHYCWFGGKQLPVQFINYMETWKRYCPDYEIVRWDEKNYDIKKTKFLWQAYQAGKWAFVSDYVRLDVLEQFGGIYLDTDVEIVKPLDDLLYSRMFCGFEQNNYIGFGPGVGAVKGEDIIGEIRELYDTMDFIHETGDYNKVSCSVYQTQVLKHNGFVLNNKFQNIDGVMVYPSEVFAPIAWSNAETFITNRTHAIHHYASTWWEDSEDEQAKKLQYNIYELKKRVRL